MTLKDQAKRCQLHVPPEFWLLDESELATYGCGPGKTWGDRIIPDTMYLLDIKVCCVIHDLDWDNAQTIIDLERANERFLINLIRFINKESSFLLRAPRRYRAMTYYDAVQDIGIKMARQKFAAIDSELRKYFPNASA